MKELLDRFLSPSVLREAVKAKCRDGVSTQRVSRLIACYVPADIAAKSDMPERLAVELIPRDQRAFFLEALKHLDPSAVSPLNNSAPKAGPALHIAGASASTVA